MITFVEPLCTPPVDNLGCALGQTVVLVYHVCSEVLVLGELALQECSTYVDDLRVPVRRGR
jgi:hypothetical protein